MSENSIRERSPPSLSSESHESKKVRRDESPESSESSTSLQSVEKRHLKSVEGWCIFVIGLHQEATIPEFKDILAEYGAVKNIQMPLDRKTGYVKGYAICEYSEESEAKAAVLALNGTEFMGLVIKCDWAFLSFGK